VWYQDEALMQKSLKEFAQTKPDLANKLGITNSKEKEKEKENNRRASARSKYREVSSSSESEDEKKPNSKFFKNKGREKEALRKRGENYDLILVEPKLMQIVNRARRAAQQS
jgi:hypothetical protein